MKIEKDSRITILSLSWRDIKSKGAGGAEVHTHEMLSRMDYTKYRVFHFAMKDESLPKQEVLDHVTYKRDGNIFTVILGAWKFYVSNRHNIDYVIDQCNTHRFFTPLWVKREKRIFYIHQLTKEIWDYSAKFPISLIGKLTEEWMLKLNKKDAVITVSESTKSELVERGYQKDKIVIVHNGVSFEPWKKEKWCKKEEAPTFIYAGRYAPYKGIDVSIKAFAELKQIYPSAKLWIIGRKNQEYVDKHILPICEEKHLIWQDMPEGVLQGEEVFSGDIISWGYVSEEKKLELLSRAWTLLFPSIREGWGIPITEAGCVGTPSIVFDSPGISEAVDYGYAGFLCEQNTVEGLHKQMQVAISNDMLYSEKREKAYQFSSKFLWDKVGGELGDFISKLYIKRKK